MAFRLRECIELLESLRAVGYALRPVEAYFEGPAGPCVFLRHDVDRMPQRAVAMAREEQAVGACATYYFRCRRGGRFPERAIGRIAELGHVIGYHYETLSREAGDVDAAIRRFSEELHALRKIVPVVTAGAHGSPLSAHDNRRMWARVSPADFGLAGEAYEGVDFRRVLYVSDTGGRFGADANVRDQVDGLILPGARTPRSLAKMLAPDRYPLVVLSCHPERWPAGWIGLGQARLADWAANACKRLAGGTGRRRTP